MRYGVWANLPFLFVSLAAQGAAPNVPFGLGGLSLGRPEQLAHAADCGAARVLVAIERRDVEPAPGRFDWAALDAFLAQAAERDLDVCVALPSAGEGSSALAGALAAHAGRRIAGYAISGAGDSRGVLYSDEIGRASCRERV